MAPTNLITISSTTIGQDDQGRFCLNDLHKAAVSSGANERTKEPGKFLASPQTMDLVAELTDTQNLGIAPVEAIKGGNKQGTYVCKELVYAYAMWISPKFHLAVIRAFDAIVTGQAQPAITPTAIPAAKEFRQLYGIARLIGLDKNVAAISANQATAKITGTNVLQLLGHTHMEAEQQVKFFTPTELGKRIGASGRAMNLLLAEAGLQAKEGEHWVPLPAAEGFFRMFDTGKKHGDGASIVQMKWADNVLSLVQKEAA